MNQGFYSVREIAEMLGVSKGRVHQLIADRGVEPAAVFNGAKFFRLEQVESLRPRRSGRPAGPGRREQGAAS